MERKFKTEMHCHTKTSSPCAVSTPEDTVQKYIEYGYSTIVVTEHLNQYVFNRYDENMSPRDKMDRWLEGYRRMKAAAGDKINVLLGAEINFPNTGGTDFLIYGPTEEFFLNNPDMIDHDRWWNCALVHNNGNMIFQSHPFRFGMMLCETHIIDGIEIYNGHTEVISHNDMSELWAKIYPNLKHVSGSDYHGGAQPPDAGILTDEPITSNEQLLEVLRSGNYDIIRDEETRIKAQR